MFSLPPTHVTVLLLTLSTTLFLFQFIILGLDLKCSSN